MRYRRAELMDRFTALASAGEPIVRGGAGTGLSAKCEEAGGIDRRAGDDRSGADLIVCYMGLTAGGPIGAETAKSPDDCVALIDADARPTGRACTRPGSRP